MKIEEKDLSDYMGETYRGQAAQQMLRAIKLKFPQIQGLELVSNVGVFKFEADAYHTKERVEAFLEDLRNNRIYDTPRTTDVKGSRKGLL